MELFIKHTELVKNRTELFKKRTELLETYIVLLILRICGCDTSFFQRI